MRILFISSLNLTSNPRILKEIELALQLKHDVTFVGFKLGNWGDKNDEDLLENRLKNLKFFYLYATRKSFFNWLAYSLIERVCRFLWSFNSKSLFFSAIAHSKRTLQLNLFLKQYNQFDLIVAHNLATLYPAYRLSRKTGIPFSFDVEDYHPGEIIKYTNAEKEIRRRKLLMSRILIHASFITYASPLIAEYSLKLFLKSDNQINQIVLNSFSESDFFEPQHSDFKERKLKFVWFSQNITFGRGLEIAIPALKNHKEKIELTLIGKISDEFSEKWISANTDFISVIEPMQQKALHRKLSEFDIGLAVEVAENDLNKKITLSNKIFAYMQAGLFIIATDTLGQKLLIDNNKDFGFVCSQNAESISNSISSILNNFENIINKKPERYRFAKSFSWENECKKIINLWNNYEKNKRAL